MPNEHKKCSFIFQYLSAKLTVSGRTSLLIAFQMFFIFAQYCINFVQDKIVYWKYIKKHSWNQCLQREMEKARVGQGSRWAVVHSLQRLQPANLSRALKLGWPFRVAPCCIHWPGIYITGLWIYSGTRNKFSQMSQLSAAKIISKRANNWELVAHSIPSS